MRALVTLLLICCLVLAMTTPASAGDYYFYKDINADDFTLALIDYSNGYKVHNMTEYNREIRYSLFVQDIKTYNVIRTDKLLDFEFDCKGWYWIILPIPPVAIPLPYSFTGNMHVVKPRDGLKQPYTLAIGEEDEKFIAVGYNWKLEARNTEGTRFKHESPVDDIETITWYDDVFTYYGQ